MLYPFINNNIEYENVPEKYKKLNNRTLDYYKNYEETPLVKGFGLDKNCIYLCPTESLKINPIYKDVSDEMIKKNLESENFKTYEYPYTNVENAQRIAQYVKVILENKKILPLNAWLNELDCPIDEIDDDGAIIMAYLYIKKHIKEIYIPVIPQFNGW